MYENRKKKYFYFCLFILCCQLIFTNYTAIAAFCGDAVEAAVALKTVVKKQFILQLN